MNSRNRTVNRTKVQRERTAEIHRESPSSIQLTTDHLMLLRKLLNAKERPTSKNRGNSAWSAQGARNSLFPPACWENLMIHRVLGRVYRKVLPH